MKIHVVRKGDTLYDIAQKYGVDLDVLIAANPQIEDPDVLMIGQKIRIPSKGVADAPPRQSESSVDAASASGDDEPTMAVAVGAEQRGKNDGDDGDDGYIRYTVRPGDTLWEIAHRYGLSLQELIAANPQIENPDLIRVGEVIRIPRRRPPMPPYGPMPPYPMPHHPPMMPSYPMYPSHPGHFPWGFHWSFVPPADEGSGNPAYGSGHGPWTPFTVWVPYDQSFPFYTDAMPGGYGHHDKHCHAPCKHPKKMFRGDGEATEQAEG